MLSKSEYHQRKDVILGMVVHEYIKTVSPVSSSQIVKAYYLNLSSATIRNILADLEKEGFLTHPHTSSGRIPTQEGYRYYVDHLMQEIKMIEEEQALIRRQYEQECKDLEILLEKTSRVISETTQYTSIISIDDYPGRLFLKGLKFIVERSNLEDIDKIRDILTALEEKERLLKILNRELNKRIQVYIGHEMACSQMEECSLAVAPYRTRQGYSGKLAVLGPTRMDYQRVVSALDYFTRLMEELS